MLLSIGRNPKVSAHLHSAPPVEPFKTVLFAPNRKDWLCKPGIRVKVLRSSTRICRDGGRSRVPAFYSAVECRFSATSAAE